MAKWQDFGPVVSLPVPVLKTLRTAWSHEDTPGHNPWMTESSKSHWPGYKGAKTPWRVAFRE